MRGFTIKRKKVWIVITCVIIIAGIVSIASMAGGVSVETAKVSKGEMKQYIEDTAQVVPKQKQTVYIEGAGKVESINVDVGDTVKKGDVLLSLDKSDLELQLKDAEAKVEASKAQLKGTDLINYANKIDLAKAALNQAQVSYNSAKRNFENVKNLYEAQAISKEDYDKAQDEYKTAQAALDTANLQLTDARKGSPDYVKNSYEAQLEQAVIFRDTILRNLQKQEARADIDGVVLEKLVDVNSLAAPSTAAFVLGSVNSIELVADIMADDVSRVKVGNTVEISGKTLENEALNGEVIKIAPAAKNVVSALGVNQKRVPVTIKITGETEQLKPGYGVDVKIITDIRNGVIKVPDSAVFDYKGNSGILVVEAGKAHAREVKKGIESGSYVEIIQGLKEGETFLIKPDNKVKDGSKVRELGASKQ